MRPAKTAQALRERLALAVRRPSTWLLLGFTLIYFGVTAALAQRKPLWNDELYTLYLAQVPCFVDIWNALAQGADVNPPLCYVATRGSCALFGASPWAVRLPAIVGFWIMSLCLYRFVARRCSPLFGGIALVFPLSTLVFTYGAFEARPYGMLFGFCGLALCCWQAATEESHRSAALVGLALSLNAAFLSHYYAVLLAVPIVLGELARSLIRKRLDLPVWLALGSLVLSFGLLFPLIEQARSYSAAYWSKPNWSDLRNVYSHMLQNVQSYLLVFCVVLVLLPERSSVDSSSSPGAPLHEVVAAGAYIALPVLGMILGICVTGVFHFRYVMGGVIGFGLMLAHVSQRRSGGNRIVAGIILGALLFVCVVGKVRDWKGLDIQQARVLDTCAYLERNTDAKLPIVMTDPVLFLQIEHYRSPALGARLCYLCDRDQALRICRTDSCDRSLQCLGRFAPVHARPYRAFLGEHQRFQVYGGSHWLLEALNVEGARCLVSGQHGERCLYSVSTRR